MCQGLDYNADKVPGCGAHISIPLPGVLSQTYPGTSIFPPRHSDFCVQTNVLVPGKLVMISLKTGRCSNFLNSEGRDMDSWVVSLWVCLQIVLFNFFSASSSPWLPLCSVYPSSWLQRTMVSLQNSVFRQGNQTGLR